MLRLARYLLRETLWLYIFGVSAFCLLLVIDFLTVWASFLIEQDAGLGTIGRLMLFRTPWFLHMSLPIAVVFAVLLATGRLAKDSELKAAYSLGVPPLKLLGPLIVFGLTVSALAFYNNGWLEPRSEIAYNREVASFYYQRPPAETQRDVSYRVPDSGIYYAARIRSDPDMREQAELSGVLIYHQDGRVMNAASGTWNSEAREWSLQNVEILSPDGHPEVLEEITLPFETESDAAAALADPQTLTLSQLYRRQEQVAGAGGEIRELAFRFHRRIADAFSATLFVLIAGTLGLQVHGRSGAFAWTIVLLVLFYFLWSFSENLFEQQVLTPAAAAWFTSVLVGSVGSVLAFVRLR